VKGVHLSKACETEFLACRYGLRNEDARGSLSSWQRPTVGFIADQESEKNLDRPLLMQEVHREIAGVNANVLGTKKASSPVNTIAQCY
jgi:hypothetical protein